MSSKKEETKVTAATKKAAEKKGAAKPAAAKKTVAKKAAESKETQTTPKLTKAELKEALINKLEGVRNVSVDEATEWDMYFALGTLVRELIGKEWVKTKKHYKENNVKQVYYFSLEFLMGKALRKDLRRLNILKDMTDILKELGFDITRVTHIEPDAGLGNGGLGRLAACFLDSLAACGYAGHGNGIRYRHGLFKQKIVNGYQVEESDNWLNTENLYEARRSSKSVEVKFYGDVVCEERNGKCYYSQVNYDPVIAVPYDTPMIGYQNNIVNTLRLWSAEPKEDEFDFSKFSRGEYSSAVEYRQSVRAISDVLYPDDSNYSNKLLRLKQQYFFVSAGLTSILRDYVALGNDIWKLDEYVAVHINDTHPALCVPELMRLLVDEYEVPWEDAWGITTRTLSYTNHTIMPEALEKWPIHMYRELLPRIFMITEEINRRLCEELYQLYPGDTGKVSYMAIIQNDVVNMANMAIAGSHSVNGVAAVHSQILRRWLVDSNPELTELITKNIGSEFIKKPLQLAKIVEKDLHHDSAFLEELGKIKYRNKTQLANFIKDKQGFLLNPDTLFDVQVKRIHAYKRQLLKAFQILDMYFDIKDNPTKVRQPMTFLFGGKAAPGYAYAKLVIKFINSVANLVNNDPDTKGIITVLFLENYNVSFAQHIFPASDLSEQISTASKEASGTGNMKFMLNGALTMGTMDGANIEIAEAVGDDNIFTFGMSVSEVLCHYRDRDYHSVNIYESDYKLRRILDTLKGDFFKDAHPGEFMPIFDSLIHQNDEYFVLADFQSYKETMERAMNLYRTEPQKWLSMSAYNIAMAGRFSSDETIRNYAKEIWFLKENKLK